MFLSVFLSCVLASTSLAHALPHIFLDFDGTVSPNETILIFADAVYEATPVNKLTLPPLKDLFADYQSNITEANKIYGPRTTIKEEVAFQSSATRRDVDLNLFERVRSSGMTRYLDLQILERAANTVFIEDAFWEFVLVSIRQGQVPSIISNSFSVQWLRTILRLSYAKFASHKAVPCDVADRIPIYCSEILASQVVPKGKFDNPTNIHCGGDKVNLIQKLIGHHPKGVLYGGNSIEDTPPLALSAFGILINSDTNVSSTLALEGAQLQDLNSCPSVGNEGNTVLFTTTGFAALKSFLERF